eukprot:3937234-Rhodomonas_salina.1
MGYGARQKAFSTQCSLGVVAGAIASGSTTSPRVLRTSYAVPGTDVVYAATSLMRVLFRSVQQNGVTTHR